MMEKLSRLPQSSAKGNGEAKKNQDTASGKLFPKSSRRRDPTSTTNSPKNEQSRKSNAQKGKNGDKRPKPKGQHYGSSKENTKKVGEDDFAEHGSVMAQGSKKQNLNHLLNFHYKPCDVRGMSSTWNPGRVSSKFNRNSNRWLPPVQGHKYNKEQFLQANCQFVVKSNGDYTPYLSDPDTLVRWDLIEQIRIHSSEILSCPICLCVPVAGKMTRCGHVYCWPCILHYLALSDKPWRKCPICYEAIHKSDLKSMVAVTQKAWNVGDNVTLRLMRRERGSLLAVPVDQTVQISTPTTFLMLLQDNSDIIYSKLLLADTDNVMDIIECERVQLKFELEEDPGSPENCFIEQALNELILREEKLCEKAKQDPGDGKTCNFEDGTLAGNIHENIQLVQQQMSAKRGEAESEIHQDYLNEHVEILIPHPPDTSNESNKTTALSKFFYFYQAEDGQHIYLHAMNVKMLELQYGCLERSPSIITGKLLEKEAGSMTEELRRRLRYLYHLPLTCQFEIAEIELKPPLISKGNLTVFSGQLETRKIRRQRHEREERKREKKIMEEENKRMGKYPTPNVHIESRRHFPQWQPESSCTSLNVLAPPESGTVSSLASSPTLNCFDIELETSYSTNAGPSFAQMLRSAGQQDASKIDWPQMNSSNLTHQADVANPLDLDLEVVDGYVPAPSYSQSFGDALSEALQQTHFEHAAVKVSTSGRKKKKGKPTILFATSMARES